MIEQPILDNPEILQHLYRRYDYLKDFPCTLKAICIEEASYLGALETDDFLGFILAYEIEEAKVSRDHFPMLSAEENLKIGHYRLLKPVEPWPQPIVGVAMKGIETGKVTGTHSVDVLLKSIGSAQLWWGEKVGILWEGILGGDIQERQDFEALMNQLWGICEEFLRNQGVQEVYAFNRDPEYAPDWYQGFLERIGYRSVEDRPCTVVKTLS